jgi:CRP-like cAMP-binding protein
MTSTQVTFPPTNQILATLSAQQLHQFDGNLQSLPLNAGLLLYEADQVPKYAYFLDSGMASEVAVTNSGASLEVAVTGKEGVVGVPGLLQYNASATRCMMQLSGHGRRIRTDRLLVAIEQDGLRNIFHRYLQSRFIQMSQLAICIHLHSVEERLARWLATSSDYSESNHFELTHEFLSQMLGARRSTVTLAAGVLHGAGLIDYRRGKINIVNRSGLEDAACECYLILRRERSKFLQPQ